MKKILLLALVAAVPLSAQVPDTTYKTGADNGSASGIYVHSFTLTRRDSVMGIVLQGNANAGSCANVWCALVPGTSPGSYGQSGGTFQTFNAAAHEVVRVWNVRHPGDTLATPVVVPPPVDTTPVPADTVKPPMYDTTYTTTRVDCAAGYRTCYLVQQNGQEIGWVRQRDTTITRRWVAGRGVVSFTPWYTTMKAAARRLVDDWHITYIPPTPTDTVHKTITVYDTVRTTVTMPTDTVRPRVVLPVDTVFMRVGDPPLILQTGDTIKIPIRVLPKCNCTDTTKPPTTSAVPELPRYTKEMDAMIQSARASDTVTRRVVDQDIKTKALIPRLDSLGRAVCNKIVVVDSAGSKWEKPIYFPCPANLP